MISEFQGNFRWLSNFAPCKIILDGIEYPSVEHAYMSAKSSERSWKLFCSNTSSPGEVKKASRGIILVDNWEDIKLSIMETCLEQKYTQEPYRKKLIDTGTEYIQEGNRWNDKFWGVCLKTNKGENNLGKLIMEIRRRITQPSV